MIILIAFLGVFLLGLTWVLTAPVTLCIDTNQPENILQIELKGIMKYSICLRDESVFFQYRIFFFSSEKDLCERKVGPVDSKKKLAGKRKKRRLKSGCHG